jgi:Spy/CpxP family protein refolding chaperone
MKRTLIAAAAVAALFSASAWAQMGPGMMGGHGSGGMGPGMMGPGMMARYGTFTGINLSDEQRAKIAAIQEESTREQRELIGKMHEQRHQLHELDSPGKVDDDAARKAYQAMSDARKVMFEISLDVRKRIDAVLTKEQREQLQSERHCG